MSDREQALNGSSKEAGAEAAWSAHAPSGGANGADFLSLASFRLAEKVVPSAWYEHAPFAFWLIEQLRPNILVELGTHNGFSYFAFCQAIRMAGLSTAAYAVDRWTGDEQAGFYGDEVFEEVKSYNQDRYQDISTLMKMSFADAIPHFEDGSVDLLHIDGRHCLEDVKEDFNSWLPKLSNRSVVLFHDINVRTTDYGVHRLWWELSPRYPNFAFIHGHGLGVLGIGQDLPPPVMKLLAAGAKEQLRTFVRSAYARLGASVVRNASEEFHRDRTSAAQEKRFAAKPPGAARAAALADQGRSDARMTHAEVQLLRHSGVFDGEWYKSQYPDALSNGALPIEHFMSEGHLRGYQPNRFFEPRWYLERYEDVRQSGQNPVIHYLRDGFREGRDPGPNFQTEFYLSANPDVREAGHNPLLHYLKHGRSEGRHPTPDTLGPGHRETISVIGRLLEQAHFENGRDTVLLIVHEASRTGAPILAWNIAKRLQERHNIVTLVLGGGDLVSAFEECSAAVIGPIDHVEPDAAEAFVETILASCSIAYAIANSIESRCYVEPLARAFVPVVSLIHEFASYFPPDARNALDWSTQIIFSTRMTLDAAKSQFPNLGGQRIHLLPQGRCDLPGYVGDAATRTAENLRAAVRPPKWQNALIVLGAGTVHLRKGVDLFLSCAAAVAAIDVQRPVRFVWIGDGYDPINDRDYCPYLAEQIARSGLADKVAILDAVEDLEPAYEVADVFFLSSRLDPLPNVTIDAAFHGLPIICFEQATGMAELFAVQPSLRSCLIPYLDVHAAAVVIARLANDETARNLLGSATRRFAEATFDLDRYVTAVDEIGHNAIAVMRQQQEDFETIRDDGLFDHRMYDPQLPTREHAIRRFVADWLAKGDEDAALRRPTPGFHPRIYAQERSNLDSAVAVNPFAHFIRSSTPSGPWRHRVIVPYARFYPAESDDRPRVGLHGHFYYPQLAHDLFKKLEANRSGVDLLLTTDTEAKATDLQQASAKYDRGEVIIRVVPNRGRDIGPLLTALAEEILQRYDIIGHLHGKRSALINGQIGDQWREFLWQNLIGDLHPMMDIIIDHFVIKPDLGLIFASDPTVCGWDTNRDLAAKIATRCGIVQPLPSQIDFPVGMMFWSRVDALRPLIELGLQWEDYPEEPVAYDGTVLHALERLLPFVARQAGYHFAVTHVPGMTR